MDALIAGKFPALVTGFGEFQGAAQTFPCAGAVNQYFEAVFVIANVGLRRVTYRV